MPASIDPELIGDYFRQVIASRLDAGELAVIYGHPERRLGRMPEIMKAIAERGRQPAAGLAGVVFRAGAVVAVAGRAKMAGHPSRGRSPGNPVRRMGHRVCVCAGHSARAVPMFGARDGLADVAWSLADLVFERREPSASRASSSRDRRRGHFRSSERSRPRSTGKR